VGFLENRIRAIVREEIKREMTLQKNDVEDVDVEESATPDLETLSGQILAFYAERNKSLAAGVPVNRFFETMLRVAEEKWQKNRLEPLGSHHMGALEYQRIIREKHVVTQRAEDLGRIEELQAQMREIAGELETLEDRYDIR
jgi:hypothetical protein